jgi:putative FmdB family regulatory protein
LALDRCECQEETSVPTYQYACTACGEQLEAVQSFSDPSLTECPACGGQLRKVFSAVGVVFKGSGFYKTDSRSAAKSGDSTSGETKKAEPAKTETTSAPAAAAPSTSSSPAA